MITNSRETRLLSIAFRSTIKTAQIIFTVHRIWIKGTFFEMIELLLSAFVVLRGWFVVSRLEQLYVKPLVWRYSPIFLEQGRDM